MNKQEQIDVLNQEVRRLQGSIDELVNLLGFGRDNSGKVKTIIGCWDVYPTSINWLKPNRSKQPVTQEEFRLLLEHLKLEVATVPATKERKVIKKV